MLIDLESNDRYRKRMLEELPDYSDHLIIRLQESILLYHKKELYKCYSESELWVENSYTNLTDMEPIKFAQINSIYFRKINK